MNSKAQGALEYLLLIGGAVLIAAIVLTLLSGIGQQQRGVTGTRVSAAQCEPLDLSRCTDPAWSDFSPANNTEGRKVPDCTWSATANKCTPV